MEEVDIELFVRNIQSLSEQDAINELGKLSEIDQTLVLNRLPHKVVSKILINQLVQNLNYNTTNNK